MVCKNSNSFLKEFVALIFLCLLFIPSQLNAQPDTLKLNRLWEVDLDQEITALKLADLDEDGTNEILAGLWDGDSGYVEVFNGLNGMLMKRSEKIHTHNIIEMDVGDIDGDGDLEVVLIAEAPIYWTDWFGSLVCVFEASQLNFEWQSIIGYQKIKSIEADDIDKDDTAEVFVGSYYWSYDTAFTGDKRAYIKEYEGALYSLDGMKKVLHTEDLSVSWRKFLTCDLDQDSYNEIVCGNGFTKRTQFPYGWTYYSREVWLQVIDQDGSRYRLSTLLTSPEPFYDEFDPPHVKSMAMGDCDSDDNKEIVSYLYVGRDLLFDDYWYVYYAGPPEYVLTITDAATGTVEKSISHPGGVVSLALFDVDGQSPDEILIANSNGKIQAIDGASFNIVAISDVLPAISFLVFEDLTGDAMPEICISDGDSLFLYGFGPTGIEEQNKGIAASEFVLDQNYPNPFNARTTIRYYLPQGSNVELAVYNIKGQKVKTLVDGFQTVGFQTTTWDGRDKSGSEVASGIYFYRIKTDYSQETRKMVLMK